MLRNLGGWHAIKITHAFPYFFCLGRADQNRRFCHKTLPNIGMVNERYNIKIIRLMRRGFGIGG